MIWIGALIVIAAFTAIVKRYDSRMVLFVAGMLMASLAGKPLVAVDEFAKAMIHPTLVPVICTVMGFSFVMKSTGCDSHLVHLLTGILSRFKLILIPGTVLVTFAINIALPSAAGCAAAVGAILIPTLISAGVHPAMAASALLAGTWGSAISPGNTHNPFVAKLANTDVMSVIAVETPSALAALAAVAVAITLIATMRREISGHAGEAKQTDLATFKVNPIKAVIPLVPLILLVLGSKQVHVLPPVSVPLAMLSGAVLGVLVCWASPQHATKQFFHGMAEGYGSIMGIIIAAMVFTKGMELIGLTGALLDLMKNSQNVARLAGVFGPFLMAVVSGSGDAAALAFNGAITPHAAQFGYGIIELGSAAQIAANIGRSMSPVAGVAIICAQMGGVNSMELTKRNALPMLIGAVVMMFILI